MKILFLYTELAEYIISCFNTLISKYNIELYIIYWQPNKEAPFSFSFPNNIKTYNKNNFSGRGLLQFCEDTAPDLIYCSGWIDLDYLFVCNKFRNKVPTIIGFDNHWNGKFKQYLGAFAGRILIHKYFSHCWIPGNPQKEFAKYLGFNKHNILTGFYSCDYHAFHNLFLRHKEEKRKKIPHRFIYAGRYYDFKGIKDLWRAFIELQKDRPNEWELWCLGAGDVTPIVHPKIKHFGFVQPKNMEKFIAECGVFVLPSRFEPWGVVVHEFASAGFPLLCSNEVGASEMFLCEGQNGFLFQAGNTQQLINVMKKIISMTDAQLFAMGEKSAELAKKITPDKWADTLWQIVNNKPQP